MRPSRSRATRDALPDADAHRRERAACRRWAATPAPRCRQCVRPTCRADGRARWRRHSDSHARASSAMPSSRSTASPGWRRPRSVRSRRSRPAVRPSRAISFRVAGTGPMPMMRGGTPAAAPPRMRAIGVRPCFCAAASEATISAAAPSLTPEALPAVTVPPLRNGVGSLASASSVVSHADARPCRRRSDRPCAAGS